MQRGTDARNLTLGFGRDVFRFLRGHAVSHSYDSKLFIQSIDNCRGDLIKGPIDVRGESLEGVAGLWGLFVKREVGEILLIAK